MPSTSIYFDLMKKFADRVDKMSNGRLKMEMLPDGAVVAAFEIVDAVDKGVVDGGYAWTHYWSGKNTAAGLFSNPAAGGGTGMDQLSHVSWLFQGGGNALYKRFFSKALKLNIESFMVQPIGPDPLGWFKNPINSLEDTKKLKYRSPPGLVCEIFKEMGINVVAMPGGEIVPAAQRGVLDAAEWIGPADDMALGFHNVFKHHYLQGLHQSTDVGCLATFILTMASGRMSRPKLKRGGLATLEISSMILLLVTASNLFGAVFSRLGSGDFLAQMLNSLALPPTALLVVILALVFVLGWPLEWVPIVLIVIPIALPIVQAAGIDLFWFCTLVAVTLQTAWLSPPVALSAYFLKGVVPQWELKDIYAGMVQFMILQLVAVGLLLMFPKLATWLPSIN